MNSLKEIQDYLKKLGILNRYQTLKNYLTNSAQLQEQLQKYKISRQQMRRSNNNQELEISPLVIELFELHLLINELAQDIAFFITKEL
ncbi:MAG: hypothetical protein LBV55_01480 [Acholeplasmatales bacterium]|jgi:hypothetical protein|nr:hypothetical protein [Acholeplasmatales bacterium]